MRRLYTLALLGSLLVVIATGCGGEDDFKSSEARPVQTGWLNHGMKLVTVILDGTEMLCLERRGNSGDYVSGQYSGLTCDWYGWRQKREDGR